MLFAKVDVTARSASIDNRMKSAGGGDGYRRVSMSIELRLRNK